MPTITRSLAPRFLSSTSWATRASARRMSWPPIIRRSTIQFLRARLPDSSKTGPTGGPIPILSSWPRKKIPLGRSAARGMGIVSHSRIGEHGTATLCQPHGTALKARPNNAIFLLCGFQWALQSHAGLFYVYACNLYVIRTGAVAQRLPDWSAWLGRNVLSQVDCWA